VSIVGVGFTGATSVTFNGVAASSYTVGSDTSITATAPTGVTSGPISVVSPAGTGVSSASFTVGSLASQVLSYDVISSTVTVTSLSESSPTGLVTAGHAVTSDGSTTKFLIEFWAVGAKLTSPPGNPNTIGIATYRNGVSMGRTVAWTDYAAYTGAGTVSGGVSAPLYGRRVSTPPAGSVTFSAGAWLDGGAGSPQMDVVAGGGGSGNYAPMSLMVTQIYPP
jgi:hypothetical protein